MLAVHADVLPLDRKRALVIDLVERADDLLEVDAAASQRAEFPEAARIAELGVAAENAGFGRREDQ